MTPAAARHAVRVAAVLHSLPVTSAAWAAGNLSTGQVDCIVANVGTKRAELFARGEHDLVPGIVPLSMPDTVTVMQAWREAADDDLDKPPRAERPNELFLSATLDGRNAVKGSFDAEAAAVIRTALRLAVTKDDDDEPRAPSQRRADAVRDICEFFLRHHDNPPAGRNRPHVSAIVDLDMFEHHGGTASLLEGGLMRRESAAALLCDSVIHRVVMQGRSTILDYGSSTQSISTALWESLVARDHHCRFPGCDRPPWWCDGHHLTWFTNHGETNPANLVMMCRRHHTRLHKPGWHAKLLPDGTLEVTDPTGRIRTTAPPGTLALAAGRC